jgi:hypothetical protein
VKITVPFLLITGAGALLLWCGITDRNPVDVMHAIFTGGTIPGKGTGAKKTTPLLPNTAPDSGGGPGPKVPPEPPLPGAFRTT